MFSFSIQISLYAFAVLEGLNVKICSFPEGDDPDSFVRKNKKEKMLEFINNESKDFVDFKLSINKDFKDDETL